MGRRTSWWMSCRAQSARPEAESRELGDRVPDGSLAGSGAKSEAQTEGVLGSQRPARRVPTFAAAMRLRAPGAEITTTSLAGSQRRALPGNDARPQASGVLQVSSARHRVAWPTAPRPCPSSPDRHLQRWGCWLHCSGTQPAIVTSLSAFPALQMSVGTVLFLL